MMKTKFSFCTFAKQKKSEAKPRLVDKLLRFNESTEVFFLRCKGTKRNFIKKYQNKFGFNHSILVEI